MNMDNRYVTFKDHVIFLLLVSIYVYFLQNIHKKSFGTHEIPAKKKFRIHNIPKRKNVGFMKYLRRHNGIRPMRSKNFSKLFK